jgi:5-methyltetrahydropteroyltriglutamate--homocysteine methyltransferase
MIRSFNHGSYPRVGASPLDQQIRAAERAHQRGAATTAELGEVADAVTTIAVAEQSRAFIDLVTDGMVRWSGPLSHLAQGLEGIELQGLRRWFRTNFYDRRPVVVAEISRRAPFLVHDYEVASRVTQKAVKVVLPGPVTFARSAIDEHYDSLEQLAEAVSQALAQEVADLAQAGATVFQIDEPLLCRYPEDAALVAKTAATIFAGAPAGATTILASYFGDLTALASKLDRLPGTHLGLEATRAHKNFALLDRLPEGKGVALGLFDATTTLLEDAADVAGWLEPHRESLTRRDVLVGPSAGLELLPRDQAFDKLLQARYLVERLSREWTWAC